MDIRISFEEIERIIGQYESIGAHRQSVCGIASLEDAGPEELAFVAGAKFFPQLEGSRAGLVIVPKNCPVQPREDQAFLAVEDPSLAVANISAYIERLLRPRPAPGIHPLAYVDPQAKVHPEAIVGPTCTVGPFAEIGKGCWLEAGAHVGRGATLGEDCHLHPRSVVHDYCRLGNRVILQPGAIIGGDGYGYIQLGKLPDLRHHKLSQIGIVVLGDDVEVGASSTIDRARFGETVVGEGTKIDNLVQVGHNVRIGRHSIIGSQVGISGSTTIGDYVVIWGQAGLVGHIEIGDGCFIGAQAGITNDLAPGSKVTGTPARPFMEQRRIDVLASRLPELFRKVDGLAKGTQD